jgi:transcriptional antiterminator
MQLEQFEIKSKAFTGDISNIISEVRSFLQSRKDEKKENNLLVHALIFSKKMTTLEILEANKNLASVYRETDFKVLGGDTSSGDENCFYLSTLV